MRLYLLLLVTLAVPNHAITPGDVATADAAVVCRPGYSASVRNVPLWLKNKVYATYGKQRVPGHCCEVDHLVPLELGGSNREQNLWPMPYPDAYAKDSVENWAHAEVCTGRRTLPAVQTQFASDWRVLYRAMHTR